MASTIGLIKTWSHQVREWLSGTEARLFFVVWLIYAIHVVPGGGVNPNRYFDLIHSLVNERAIYIDAYQENTIDKAYKDGHYYSVGLPGPSWLGIPSYIAFKALYALVPDTLLKSLSSVQSYKQDTAGGFYARDNTDFFLSTIWITWFTLSLLSSMSAVVLFRVLITLDLSPVLALIGTLLYAFGTLVFPYSTTFFSHAFSAALAVIALYLVIHARSFSAPYMWFALGFVLGSVILMEYWNWLVIGVISCYMLYRFGIKPLGLFVPGLIVPIALFFSYNTLAFGSPLHVAYEFLVGSNRDRVQGVGWLGFSVPTPERVFGLLFSPERGMFVYAPILLLGLVGCLMGLRAKRQFLRDVAGLSMVISCGVVLWVAAYEDWKGGASFGPRQIVLITPFLFVGVAFAFDAIPRLVWIPLGILSVLNNWLGAQFGFAQDIYEPWRTFFQQGFTLPAISALLSHSRAANPFTLFLSSWGWTLILLYAFVIFIALAWLFASLRRNDASLTLNVASVDSA